MILDDIVAAKRRDLERVRAQVPLQELQGRIARPAAPLDFAAALKGPGVSIIAEVKQASPSRGLLCADFDHIRLARTYAAGAAAAISVLTEASYFQGSLDYLVEIRETPGLGGVPLLRKDFLFDPYQIYEARAYGADAVLLITAILDDGRLEELLGLARELGMQCLVEVHDRSELERALSSGAGIIGINNRNLHTFEVDIAATQRLRRFIPAGRTVVSESGISRRQDIEQLQGWNIDAALVGEALVTAPDVALRLRELV